MQKIRYITKEELEKCYCSNLLTIKQIAKKYNCSRTSVRTKLKKWNITILYNRNRERDSIHLTDIQKQAIIGMMLGNSNIRKGKKRCQMRFVHSEKQKEYLEWKKKILFPFSNDICSLYNKKFNYTQYYFQTWYHADFNYYYWLFYKDSKKRNNKIIKKQALKKLTPLGLAIWIMDDGSCIKNKHNEIYSIDIYIGKYHGYSKIKLCQFILKEKFNLETVIYTTHKTCYTIRFLKNELSKLMNIINQYIYPSMHYKFPPSETLCGIHQENDVKTKSELHSDM